MNGQILDKTECEKDVGIFINSDLKVKPSVHCAKSAGKANVILGMMSRAFHFRDKEIWIRLYKTYVRPHLVQRAPGPRG